MTSLLCTTISPKGNKFNNWQWVIFLSNNYKIAVTSYHTQNISMVWCKAAVTPMLTHSSCCSLALSDRYQYFCTIQHFTYCQISTSYELWHLRPVWFIENTCILKINLWMRSSRELTFVVDWVKSTQLFHRLRMLNPVFIHRWKHRQIHITVTS